MGVDVNDLSSLLDVMIVEREQQAENIISLSLRSTSGLELPSFEAGSHIDVHVLPGVVRPYSLWNDPAERTHYKIGVLKEKASRGGSTAIHDTFVVGKRIQIGLPLNNFPLNQFAARSLLFAGGIGITPIMSMASHLHKLKADFEIHYCCRSRDSAAFRGELSGSPFSSQVHFHFDDGHMHQRLALEDVLDSPAGHTHLYVCGPSGFMDYVTQTAARLGWPASNVHVEYFNADVSSTGFDFTVLAKRSNVRVTVFSGQTIVEALHTKGISVPISCEQGVCGTCLTTVLEGIPDHRDHYQTGEEKALNRQITPCCSRALSPLLVLDL